MNSSASWFDVAEQTETDTAEPVLKDKHCPTLCPFVFSVFLWVSQK